MRVSSPFSALNPARRGPGGRRPDGRGRAGGHHPAARLPDGRVLFARGAEGTHDPLLAKAFVFEKDGTRVALVALDLIATTFVTVAESCKLVEQRTGISIDVTERVSTTIKIDCKENDERIPNRFRVVVFLLPSGIFAIINYLIKTAF